LNGISVRHKDKTQSALSGIRTGDFTFEDQYIQYVQWCTKYGRFTQEINEHEGHYGMQINKELSN